MLFGFSIKLHMNVSIAVYFINFFKCFTIYRYFLLFTFKLRPARNLQSLQNVHMRTFCNPNYFYFKIDYTSFAGLYCI